MPELNNS